MATKNETAGGRIMELRKSYGLTQQELGKALGGLSAMSISRYEKGVSPDIDTLNKMAKLFNCSVDYLTGYTEVQQNIIIHYDNNGKLDGAVGYAPEMKDLLKKHGFQARTPEDCLLDVFQTLNPIGQEKAIDHVSELAKIPEYQKKVDSCPEQPKMPEQSENEKTDSGKPE